MIQCPKCAHQLPDWSQTCQFCQADLKNVPRPKPDPKMGRPVLTGPAPWVWPVYYVCAGWFILNGVLAAISGVAIMSKANDSAAGGMLGSFGYIALVVAGIELVMGIGLVARIEFIRGIANIWCWLQIVVSSLGLVGSLLAGGFFTMLGLIGIISNVFNITTGGLLIYLIGETD